MKITLSWLAQYLDGELTVDAVTETMTRTGLEVEEVDDPARRLAAFSVATVKKAEPHPNADKLQLCTVDTVDGEKHIVCGAANARVGLKTAYAPVGAYVPGADMTLKRVKIRGVESSGMLCSGKELELTAEAEGILELPGDAQTGESLAKALGLEPVIDFAVTPNRPDWLGVKGVARDLAAAGVGVLKEDPEPNLTTTPTTDLSVATKAPEACPLFTARRIRGVKNGPSPAWLAQALEAVGMRPISRIVDVTNYIAHDRCRPLHAYDARQVTGTLHARMAEAGETFTALGGESYTLTGEECVIADDTGALGLGGIIGGQASGAQEDTTDIILEAAYFDPVRTARTGRRHGIDTDSRRRFERGVDPQTTLEDLDRATAMLLALCGGEAEPAQVGGAVPPLSPAITFNPDHTARLLGASPGDDLARGRLEALGFHVEVTGPKSWAVQPPGWRPDVEGGADLVEEIGRLEGFDLAPSALPPAQLPRATDAGEAFRQEARCRRALAARGHREVVSWGFMDGEAAKLFTPENAHIPALENPIASDLSHMRPTMVANLARMLEADAARGRPGGGVFEMGPLFEGEEPGDQGRAITLVVDPRAPRHWHGEASYDVYDLKADMLEALRAAGAPVSRLKVSQGGPGWLHPGRSGQVMLGNQVLGAFGVLHPRVAGQLDLSFTAFVCEVRLDHVPLKRAKGFARPVLERSDLMPLHRDFAFLWPQDEPAAALLEAVERIDPQLITAVRIFDVYAGKGVPEGKRSLAMEIDIEPKDATLTDQQIDALSKKVIDKAQSLGAELRQ